jgi:hypothetical protein
MVKKVKGLKIARDLLEKFRFDSEGQSTFGSSQDDTHTLVGETSAVDVDLTGQMTLEERISSALFGVPQIDGVADMADLQDLLDNATDYEGFMIYLTSPSTLAPFVDNQKFYFCESGTWHPSPFRMEDSDTDGDGIPDTQDPFILEETNTGETNVVLNTTNLQNDPIFETDSSGDVMIDATPGGTNGNFELDDQGDVMPSAS